MAKNSRFRHESLQDRKSVTKYLEALTQAISKGEVALEDDDGTMVLAPEGLLHLKVSGSQEDGRNRLAIRLSWETSSDVSKKKTLKIS